MNAEDITREFPKGILNWYTFRKNSKALLITNTTSVLEELLKEQCEEVYVKSVAETGEVTAMVAGDATPGARVTTEATAMVPDVATAEEAATLARTEETAAFFRKHKGSFDYVVLVGLLEEVKDPAEYLLGIKSLLSATGHLLLGADNRLGIRYFCGDRDPYTRRSFDGVEHYKGLTKKDKDNLKGRCYSRDELKSILNTAGFETSKFYSVLPNLSMPQLIYAENYLPVEELAIRYFPMYNYPDSVFLEEEHLYTDLVRNGLFHTMANSYLIDCSLQGDFDTVLHATLSLDRGPENALATIIRGENEPESVEKRSLYPAGLSKLQLMVDNVNDLKAHGIPVVDANITDDTFVMPYIKTDTALNYMRALAKTDVEQFIKEVDRFRDFIMQSSEHVGTDEKLGVLLKRAYIDMVPLNCFYHNGEYLFYDQEFYEENYPASVIVYRAVDILYIGGDQELEGILPKQFFLERYGLQENLSLLQRKANDFIIELRNLKVLRTFSENYQRDGRILNSNRQKINYSQAEYQKKFIDIFRNAENKKIILFGSGIFAKRFLAQFKKDYPIYAIIDNNQTTWGKELEGITIQSPDILKDLDKSDICMIICVKNYMGIAHQLEQMGYEDYRIYDYNIEYPRKRHAIEAQTVGGGTGAAVGNNHSLGNVGSIKNGGNEGTERIDGNMQNIQNAQKKKYHTGYVAGVFDLFHIGHLNMFKRAKEQCEYLIVGVVSDEGVRINKKTEPFVPFEERIEMVRSCRYVDEAVEIPFSFAGTRDAYNMYHFDCQFSGSDYINDPSWLAEKMFLEKNGAEMVFFPYTESTSSSKLKKLISEKLL